MILIDEMALSIEWLYYIINGICADGEQAKSVLVFWRKNESVAIHR